MHFFPFQTKLVCDRGAWFLKEIQEKNTSFNIFIKHHIASIAYVGNITFQHLQFIGALIKYFSEL